MGSTVSTWTSKAFSIDSTPSAQAAAAGPHVAPPTTTARRVSASRPASDDRVLLHCHAGCTTEAVLAALDLTPADLFADSEAGDPDQTEAVYAYLDEQGTVLYEVVRLPGKQFRQRRPNPKGGYSGTCGASPASFTACLSSRPRSGSRRCTWLRARRTPTRSPPPAVVATTNVGGAGKWKSAYAEVLRGADVVIVADQDEPGLQTRRTGPKEPHGRGCLGAGRGREGGQGRLRPPRRRVHLGRVPAPGSVRARPRRPQRALGRRDPGRPPG